MSIAEMPRIRAARVPWPEPTYSDPLTDYRETIKRGRILLVPLQWARKYLADVLALLEADSRERVLTEEQAEWVVLLLRARYGWPDRDGSLSAVCTDSRHPDSLLVRCWHPSWPSVGEGELFPKFAPVGPLDRIEPAREEA